MLELHAGHNSLQVRSECQYLCSYVCTETCFTQCQRRFVVIYLLNQVFTNGNYLPHGNLVQKDNFWIVYAFIMAYCTAYMVYWFSIPVLYIMNT